MYQFYLYMTCRIFVALSCLLIGWKEADREHLGQELSDVLIYLVRLAEQCHVDLPAAVMNKFKLNALKYPPGKAAEAKLKYCSQEKKESVSET